MSVFVRCFKGNKPRVEDGVERTLREDQLRQLLQFKVLLLGAGESGKSTVVKQLTLVHKGKLDQDDMAIFAQSLHKNALDCIVVLIASANKLGISLDYPSLKGALEAVDQYQKDESVGTPWISEDLSICILTLWHSEPIQATYSRRSEYWLLEATNYYLENLHRFVEPNFVPTEEDCIMARVRTSGIVTSDFQVPDKTLGDISYSIVDVGGQRNERKKWIHCFDDVEAVLFVVNLGGYNTVMFEDQSKNRMHESLELFKDVCSKPAFKNCPIVLFLNKKDLFEGMLKSASLKNCFPDYEGDDSVMDALNFIKHKFSDQLPEGRKVQEHFVSARFKKDIKYAFADVHNGLLDTNRAHIEKMKAQLSKPGK